MISGGGAAWEDRFLSAAAQVRGEYGSIAGVSRSMDARASRISQQAKKQEVMERSVHGDSSAGTWCVRHNSVARRERLTRYVFDVYHFSFDHDGEVAIVLRLQKDNIRGQYMGD